MSIVVAGVTGLVGSALSRELSRRELDFIGVSSKDVDLLDREATFDFFHSTKPDLVIDAAAKTGGIQANNSMPVDFLSINIRIQTNILDACHSANVERLVFLGSSCIYPRDCFQPIKEEYLLSGPLEATNSAYAIAKIAGIEGVKSYRRQYDHRWISLMPTNLYGPCDNFDLESSHVIPGMLHKFHRAKENLSEVTLWGSGKPRREFLHVDDLAKAILFTAEFYDEDQHLNIGYGSDISIEKLAEMIAQTTGYKGTLKWNQIYPDGTPRKLLDSTKIFKMGWKPEIDLVDGLSATYNWFCSNLHIIEGVNS